MRWSTAESLQESGVSPFLSGPGAMTPMDCPSMYGTLPPWLKVTWQVSQLGSPVCSVKVWGCTTFFTTSPLYGALGEKRFQGISFPCTTFTPFFFTAAARHEVEDSDLLIAANARAAAPRQMQAPFPWSLKPSLGACDWPGRSTASGAVCGTPAVKARAICSGVDFSRPKLNKILWAKPYSKSEKMKSRSNELSNHPQTTPLKLNMNHEYWASLPPQPSHSGALSKLHMKKQASSTRPGPGQR